MTLYIDPGTGSMLFTILLGVIGAGIYSLRMLFIKMKFMLSGGKVDVDQNKIPFVILRAFAVYISAENGESDVTSEKLSSQGMREETFIALITIAVNSLLVM